MRLFTGALFLSTTLLACGDKSGDTASTEPSTEPSTEDTTDTTDTTTEATPEELGQALYDAKCAACHGADAKGASGPNITNQSDNKFFSAIQNGEGPMPAFPELSDTDIGNIIAYVRSL